MQKTTIVALVLAPLLVPLFRWAATFPGKKAHDFLWRKLPDGKLRSILLKKVR